MSVNDETVIAAVTAAVGTMMRSATVTTTVITIASLTAMAVADVAMRTASTTIFAARGSATAPRC
jgi:hypothetical protein